MVAAFHVTAWSVIVRRHVERSSFSYTITGVPDLIREWNVLPNAERSRPGSATMNWILHGEAREAGRAMFQATDTSNAVFVTMNIT